MAESKLCGICRKRPVGKDWKGACDRCTAQLKRESGRENPCSLCGNAIPSNATVCSKCEDKVYDRKGSKKKHYTKKPVSLAGGKIFRLLNRNKGRFTSVDEISKRTGLTDSAVRAALALSLKHLVVKEEDDSDRWKLKESVDDVPSSVSAILDGSSVNDEIGRLLDVVHD